MIIGFLKYNVKIWSFDHFVEVEERHIYVQDIVICNVIGMYINVILHIKSVQFVISDFGDLQIPLTDRIPVT